MGVEGRTTEDHLNLKEQRRVPTDYEYPFAAAPDIIRSYQKDAYFQSVVFDQISDVLRRLYGARFLHNSAASAKMLSHLMYLGLTTLLGNKTLGEEYCDMIQVEDYTRQLPSVHKRAGYILSTVILPYCLTRWLPKFRQRLRLELESSLRQYNDEKHPSRQAVQSSLSNRTREYLLAHLDSITSPSALYATNLAVFYFSGAYYHLGQRLWGLRYIFPKRISQGEQRVGYEVLGVLLAVQMVLQAWLHLRHQLTGRMLETSNLDPTLAGSTTGNDDVDGVKSAYSDAEENLLDLDTKTLIANISRPERITHTIWPPKPRYDLHERETMGWIQGRQQRKCTLCLEEMREPSVTTCGHVFCWTCIGDWCREKPECPLCRQMSFPQHILPLRDEHLAGIGLE